MICAKDIMTTQVITIQENVTIKDAVRYLIELDISALIVADANQQPIGLVSERDMIVAYEMMQQASAPIFDFIVRKIISVEEDTPVEEVSRVLIQRNIQRVAVMTDGNVKGIISRKDVLKHYFKNM